MRTPPPPEPKQELAGEQTIEWTEVVTNLKNGIEMTDYAMCDGLLYKVLDCQGGPPLRLCLPTRWRTEIIRACHDDITADHMGQTRTLNKVRQRYFWPRMDADIIQHVRCCHPCQARKGIYRKPSGFLEVSHVERSFERVGVDILGPFSVSRSGNKYIVVAVDYVTKWAETMALQTGQAKPVSAFFVQRIVLRHGAPLFIYGSGQVFYC